MTATTLTVPDREPGVPLSRPPAPARQRLSLRRGEAVLCRCPEKVGADPVPSPDYHCRGCARCGLLRP